MGNSESSTPNKEAEKAYTGETSEHLSSNYLCLFFCRGDRLKIILGSQEVRDAIVASVNSFWGSGIKTLNDHGYYLSVVCSGYPFRRGQGSQNAIAVRLMACDFLRILYGLGWVHLFSSNLTRRDDITSMFFRRSSPERPLQAVACMALSSYDAINFLNFPESSETMIVDCVKSGYKFGIQEMEGKGSHGFQIKLHGTPWQAGGEKKWAGRELLLSLIHDLELNSLCFYGTGDLKGTSDALFFMHGVNYAARNAKYGMLSLDGNDKLRLLRLPESFISALQELIPEYWQPGIQSQGPYEGAYEFKLHGKPWWVDGEDTIKSRCFVTQIIRCVHQQGFRVLGTLGLSRKLTDKSAFVLRSVTAAESQNAATEKEYMCVSLNETDKLRLIESPDPTLVDRVRNIITQRWPAGIQAEKSCLDGIAYEFKLRGNSWGEARKEGVAARALMCCILQLLESEDWHVVCSADVSSKYYHYNDGKGTNIEYPLDVDSWFMARPRGARGRMDGFAGSAASALPEPEFSDGFERMPPPAYPADPSAPPPYAFT